MTAHRAPLSIERTPAELLHRLRAAGLQHKRLRCEDGELRDHVPLTFVDELASVSNTAA